MSTSSRLDYEGAVHHVMNRSSRRRTLWGSDAQRDAFVWQLSQLPEAFDIEVLAYVLLPDAVHAILRSPGEGLSPALAQLGAVQIQDEESDAEPGPSYCGRFRNRIVLTRSYLSYLVGWVHLRPVPDLAPTPEAWRWSSAQALMDVERCPEWLGAATLGELMGGETVASVTRAIQRGERTAPPAFDASLLWSGGVTGRVGRVSNYPPEAVLVAARACLQGMEGPAATLARAEWFEVRCLQELAGLEVRDIARVLDLTTVAVGRALRRADSADGPGLETAIDCVAERLDGVR